MSVTIVPTLTEIHDADTDTNYVTDNGQAVLLISGFQREGSGCVGYQISEEEGNIWNNSITAFDARNTRIYVWLLAGIIVELKSAGGYKVVIGDGTNTISYVTGGRDEPGHNYQGWVCQMLDTANLPTDFTVIAGSEGSLDLENITSVGGGFTTANKAVGNVDNVWIDIMRYGKGLVVTGGTESDPGQFSEILADDDSTTTAFGIIESLEEGVFGFQGDLTFGDTGSSNTYFQDDDAVVVLENHIHASGSVVTPFEIAVYGGSGTTHFELGIPVGTGDDQIGRNAIQIRNANLTHNPLSFIAVSPHVEDVLLYGTNLIGAYNEDLPESVLFSPHPGNGPNHRMSGMVFDRCGQVDTGQAVVRNSVFQSTRQGTGTIGRGASALLWSPVADVEKSSFIANQLEQIFGAGVSGSHGIEHRESGTFTYVGLNFSANDYDLEFSAPTGTLTVQATQDSNPSTYQITQGGVPPVDIQNNKTLTLIDLQTDSEVRVYENVAGEAGDELAGTESSGTTFDIVYNYGASDIPVIIVILHIDFIIQRVFLDLTDSDATLPIVYSTDRVYSNP